jgi:DNA-3-methyladenine glycosylase I
MSSNIIRCPWVPVGNLLYQQYHDEEWGVPVHEDRKHFEFLILEGAQAGLSWETILKRRESYRQAFANFDPTAVARFDDERIDALLHNPGIIRNKLKVRAVVLNAKVFMEIQNEFGSFDRYIWGFVNGKTTQHELRVMADYPVTCAEAEKLSKDLKKRGMSFVGPTIMYAYMQACGLVNDHTVNCFRYKKLS